MQGILGSKPGRALLTFAGLFIFSGVRCGGYSSDRLAEGFRSAGLPIVFDPDGYLSAGAEAEIVDIARRTFWNVTFGLVVLGSSDLAGSSGVFEDWVEDFAIKCFAEPEKLAKSLLAVYSLEDRYNLIRTGEDLKEIYQEDPLLRIKDGIVRHLSARDYDSAFIRLLENLSNYNRYTSYGFGGGFIFLVVVGSILAVVGVTAVVRKIAKVYFGKKLRKFFENFQSLKKSGENFQLFVRERCLVCLQQLGRAERPDDFDPSRGFNPRADDSETNKFAPSTTRVQNMALFDSNLPEALKDTSDPASLNPTETPAIPLPPIEIKGEIIETENGLSLPCGHSFHKTCTKALLKIERKCPICKNEGGVSDYPSLEKALIDLYAERYKGLFNKSEILLLLFSPSCPLLDKAPMAPNNPPSSQQTGTADAGGAQVEAEPLGF